MDVNTEWITVNSIALPFIQSVADRVFVDIVGKLDMNKIAEQGSADLSALDTD